MTGILIAMYIGGAILTAAAIVRHLRRASLTLRDIEESVQERGHANSSYGDVQAELGGDRRLRARAARSELVVDLALIGLGSAMSATASILSITAI
jgi:hypothetical protein